MFRNDIIDCGSRLFLVFGRHSPGLVPTSELETIYPIRAVVKKIIRMVLLGPHIRARPWRPSLRKECESAVLSMSSRSIAKFKLAPSSMSSLCCVSALLGRYGVCIPTMTAIYNAAAVEVERGVCLLSRNGCCLREKKI
ncbi:hypothetical protein BC939DRAFT_10735 [Gamsiella multidivaricata]|uniref:uncharacterized protein n=1 Tax=Gamsiella multidivaricata TaxID=101098 RepID=UPI00221EF8BA|nr:uncharacterized protein BC939DRAFT_10735 [Gamsiella multidivaricata]KAI7829543.1 hypothetical protein BC939DRAFT_10735 [Gamsiella multidivaricata]